MSVVVPARGAHALTRAVVADLDRERDVADLLVVDSRGDYLSARGESVLRPSTPMNWVEACNFGLAYGFAQHYEQVVLINNDVRLSPCFLSGLLATALPGFGLCGPLYDDVWDTQRSEFLGPAERFEPKDEAWDVPFLDGTCLLVTRPAYEGVGGLDGVRFGRHGWAADFDLSLRVRRFGLRVAVTARSYLNHLGQATASMVTPAHESDAVLEADAGMRDLYGDDWPTVLGGAEMVKAVYARVLEGKAARCLAS